MANVFIDHKRTVLQIARANDVDISVAANIALQMANEVNAEQPVSHSLLGVVGFNAFCNDVAEYTPLELGAQMAEYNKAATEAARKGENWVL